uniref:APC membrane recruitment protein 1-like n=1 Tax=Doryrhamphus excisus TaxID=161450 RepID=UPI0025AEC7BF|nr:APC membrane recruitment protein 1-like [Doryrhamphus excisus]XP_057933191.1 APC membrane recruitment protein 1-like [Doryrhamphus excisus]XP_057933192.1 APC membrane recruitment protein 1-like [Doryrhamphus excisus]
MASCDVDKPPSKTRDLDTVSGTLSRCSLPDVTEEHQPDTSNAIIKSQKAGKFRTALTFFGVRKSMCILPSFFGGRSKNQSRWSSKKGIYKSKTHDGLSQISNDNSLRGGSTSTADFEYHNQSDRVEKLHSNECNVMPLPSEHKSQSLNRQKRSLKSFLNNFKHHKNHRNCGSEKTETIVMSSPHCQKVAVVQDSPHQFVTECLESEPDVPDFAICDISLAPECTDVEMVAFEKNLKQDRPKTELGDDLSLDHIDESHLMAVVSSEYKDIGRGHSEPCLLLEMMPDPALKSETPASSSDQLNLIYGGEVASLKSFDSLTGCGDIIADQEDDSLTESTASGERSRNGGGKRASCFLTYQGGGEEMASPEDLDEQCLEGFWDNNASADPCFSCNQDHTNSANPTCSHNMALVNSDGAHQASAMNTSADVLTPQSEHQESVPNSDEGYYDSTTPGPDEGQDRIDHLRTDRLPRDSYSGDALYELFATDESLISPHNESKHRLPSSIPSERLDGTDLAFSDINALKGTDLYKGKDFIEVQGTCKTLELTQNVALQAIDWTKYHLSSKPQATENYEADAFDEKGKVLASSKIMNVEEKRHSNISFTSTSDPDFETFCEPKEQQLEENKPVALPFRNVNSQTLDCSSLDGDQTVCFSQALENYEKTSQMLSDLHNTSVDVLETNTALTPNMEALPTIVAFDVVDLHNEGEYDEQIHIELEEDISSPYQELEDGYLQKDAFAECDDQMLDLYEQSLISNMWAIASLPRHRGLTRLSQTMSNPLSLERRSRSLDTESLQLNIPDAYRQGRAASLSCPQAGRDYERYYKKNVLVSAPQVRDGGRAMALPWQMRSEMSFSHPLRDGSLTEVVQKHTLFSDSSSRCLPNSKIHLCSDVPMSQEAELCSRPCHLPLPSGSCLSHSTLATPCNTDKDEFCKAAADLQSYIQCGKSRQAAIREKATLTSVPTDDPPKDATSTAADNKHHNLSLNLKGSQ